jgi:hypothetical protein
LDRKNSFDVELYDYALQLFEAQGTLILQMSSHHSSGDYITSQQNEGSLSDGDRNIPGGQGKLASQFLYERAGVDKISTSEVGQPGIPSDRGKKIQQPSRKLSRLPAKMTT